MKKCKGPCQKTLPAKTTHFYRNQEAKDGMSNLCKVCRKSQERGEMELPPDGSKRCKGGCYQIFPDDEQHFPPSKMSLDGTGWHCNECTEKRGYLEYMANQKCKGPCGRVLHVDESNFYVKKNALSGFSKVCRECNRVRNVEYKKKNKGSWWKTKKRQKRSDCEDEEY